MRTPTATLLTVLLITTPSAAQVVIDAQPTIKVESSKDGTSRTELTEADRKQYRVKITKVDGRYYWVTRENHELVYVRSGAFHHFIDTAGSGYIKIFDTHAQPASLRDPGPRYQYMEHLTLWLTTITYWGTADEASLP